MAKKPQAGNSHYVLTAKVSTKGAVSIYGMGRFPVTLYADQLIAVLDKEAELRAFVKAKAKELKAKPDAASGPAGATAL